MANINEMISYNENITLGRMINDAKNQAARHLINGRSSDLHLKKKVTKFVDDAVVEWCRDNCPAPTVEHFQDAKEFFSSYAKDWIIEKWNKEV